MYDIYCICDIYIYMTYVILMYDMLCMMFIMDRNWKKNWLKFFSRNLQFIKRSRVFKITLAIYLLNPPLVHNNQSRYGLNIKNYILVNIGKDQLKCRLRLTDINWYLDQIILTNYPLILNNYWLRMTKTRYVDYGYIILVNID